MKTTEAFLGGAAVGAALTSIADPRLGKRRRAIARDAAIHLARILAQAAGIGILDFRNRIKGVLEETKKLAENETVDDPVLEDRVRTEVGRASSHRNVEVIVEDGNVTLLGPVVEWEEDLVLEAARSVDGVTYPGQPSISMVQRKQRI